MKKQAGNMTWVSDIMFRRSRNKFAIINHDIEVNRKMINSDIRIASVEVIDICIIYKKKYCQTSPNPKLC